MRVAIVFYGQPRDYEKGYSTIMEFCNKQHGCEFDFYYHCWTLKEGEKFNVALSRYISEEQKTFHEDTLKRLTELYTPISYEYEYQTDAIIEPMMEELKARNEPLDKNSKNILFQMYSRTKAKNILKQSNIQYDRVIMTRFDLNIMPDIILTETDNESTYISDYHFPRKIFPDHTVISPMDVFLEWINIYDDLLVLVENEKMRKLLLSYKEPFGICAESLMLASYVVKNHNLEKIKYFKGGMNER